MKQLKNKILLALAGLLLTGASFLVGNVTPVKLGSTIVNPCATSGTLATTTNIFVLTSATSTVVGPCSIEGSELSDLNLFVNASTTGTTVLLFTHEFSPDGNEWYPEKGQTNTNNSVITLGGGPLVWSLTPTVASSTHNLTVTPTSNKYYRLRMQASGANAGVHAVLTRTVN